MRSAEQQILKRKLTELFHNRLNNKWFSPNSYRRAKETAHIQAQWNILEDLELVRIRLEPDEMYSWEDLEGDTFNVEYNKDSVPGGERTIKAQQKEYRKRIQREGVWVALGEYRINEQSPWIVGDSIGMLDSCDDDLCGYADDIKAQTIEYLKKDLKSRCPKCRQMQHH